MWFGSDWLFHKLIREYGNSRVFCSKYMELGQDEISLLSILCCKNKFHSTHGATANPYVINVFKSVNFWKMCLCTYRLLLGLQPPRTRILFLFIFLNNAVFFTSVWASRPSRGANGLFMAGLMWPGPPGLFMFVEAAKEGIQKFVACIQHFLH